MKKILLLSTATLAMLMADFTLDRQGGILTPVSETTPPVTEPAPPTETTPPPAVGGVIPNSVDLIWSDMHDAPTGYPALMPAGFPQAKGGYIRDIAQQGAWASINTWIEIEEAGSPQSGCSASISRSTNTRVEIGYLHGWVLRNNGVWEKIGSVKQATGGNAIPGAGILFEANRNCTDPIFGNTQQANPTSSIVRTEDSGYLSAKPRYYYRMHKWVPAKTIANPREIVAVFGQVYMRLVLEDPNGVDDRDKAKFVAHVGADIKDSNNKYMSGTSVSKYKMITKDWQPISMLSYIAREDLDKTPPPFTTTPYQ